MDPLRVDPAHPDGATIARAAAILRQGGVVAFPTETVYGLGASALDDAAVRRVFAAKGRPADNPLIVHVAAWAEVAGIASHVPALARELAERWWPGPLTLVLDAHPALPEATTAGLRTVAVRMPDHPIALALIAATGRPLAAPSANRSGRPSPTSAAHVAADLGGSVDLILDGGPCRVGVESTVVDVRGGHPIVLREGSVTREDLHTGAVDTHAGGADAGDADIGASPGVRHRHYQPACRVLLAEPGGAAALASAQARHGVRVGLVASEAAPAGVVGVARFSGTADLAAQLYEALRAAEVAAVDVVVVEGVEEVGLGRAVMDRLRRSAGL